MWLSRNTGLEGALEAEPPLALLNQTPIGAAAKISASRLHYRGQIDRLAPQADSVTHLGAVRIRILGSSALRSGQLVKVAWSRLPRKTWALPAACVRGPAAQAFVFVRIEQFQAGQSPTARFVMRIGPHGSHDCMELLCEAI